jgi:hypothetical protein
MKAKVAVIPSVQTGTYPAKLLSVEEKRSKDGKENYMELVFKLKLTDYGNTNSPTPTIVWDEYVDMKYFTDVKFDKGGKLYRAYVALNGQSIQVGEVSDTATWLGKVCRAVVSPVKNKKTGETQNKITTILSL